MFASCEVTNDEKNDRIKWNEHDFSKLTYKYLIKQSMVDAVSSVSQALTVTYTAIQSTSMESTSKK